MITYHHTCWRASQQAPFSATDIKSQSTYKGCSPGTKAIRLWHARLPREIRIQTCEGQP